MRKSIKCPECGETTDYSLENEHRPFCSKRCKLIDLGEWIEGEYRINSEESYQTSESLEKEFNTKH